MAEPLYKIFLDNRNGVYGSGLLSDTIDTYEEIIGAESDLAQCAILEQDLRDIMDVAPSILGGKSG